MMQLDAGFMAECRQLMLAFAPGGVTLEGTALALPPESAAVLGPAPLR